LERAPLGYDTDSRVSLAKLSSRWLAEAWNRAGSPYGRVTSMPAVVIDWFGASNDARSG
jgi:hypothetical protein